MPQLDSAPSVTYIGISKRGRLGSLSTSFFKLKMVYRANPVLLGDLKGDNGQKSAIPPGVARRTDAPLLQNQP